MSDVPLFFYDFLKILWNFDIVRAKPDVGRNRRPINTILVLGNSEEDSGGPPGVRNGFYLADFPQNDVKVTSSFLLFFFRHDGWSTLLPLYNSRDKIK